MNAMPLSRCRSSSQLRSPQSDSQSTRLYWRMPWSSGERAGCPGWLLSIHRYLGGLASIFVIVHVFGIVADTYVHFGLVDVLVPLASSWHPVAVAWGVVAMWLLVAVEITSLARASMPRAVWRWVHMSSYPLFLLALTFALWVVTRARRQLAQPEPEQT